MNGRLAHDHASSNWMNGLLSKLSFHWHQIHHPPTIPFRLLQIINGWMKSSPSGHSNLTLNIVFIIKDVLAFAKIHIWENEIWCTFTTEGTGCSIDKMEVLFCSWWEKAFILSTLTQHNLLECLIRQKFFQIPFLFINTRNNNILTVATFTKHLLYARHCIRSFTKQNHKSSQYPSKIVLNHLHFENKQTETLFAQGHTREAVKFSFGLNLKSLFFLEFHDILNLTAQIIQCLTSFGQILLPHLFFVKKQKSTELEGQEPRMLDGFSHLILTRPEVT